MTAKLDNLVKINSLKKEPPNLEEYGGLINAAESSLEDAHNESLSLVSRFTLAYGASFKFCLAALRRLGYRSNNKRHLVFQMLPETLALGPEIWRILDDCHEKRNLGEYEGVLEVNEQTLKDLIAATRRVADELMALPPIPADT